MLKEGIDMPTKKRKVQGDANIRSEIERQAGKDSGFHWEIYYSFCETPESRTENNELKL